MFLPAIIQDYFIWHYGRAWWELWGVWRNYIWFVTHLFSIPELMRSWISPFKRIQESRGQAFNLEDFAGFVIINILSRIVGAIARTAVIFAGLVTLAITISVGFLVYTIWMLLPTLVFGLIGMSVSLFFISI